MVMDKIALGIHVGHDRGACLIINGRVIAAIANERLDRQKHSQSLEIPYESIDALLKFADKTVEDISVIGLSAVAIEGNSIKNLYYKEFFEHYQCSHKPFYFVHHHEAHAYSTYYSSGLEKALVFVFDGGGDFFDSMQEAETIYLANNGIFTTIDKRF